MLKCNKKNFSIEDRESIDRLNKIWGKNVSDIDTFSQIMKVCNPKNIVIKYLMDRDNLYDSYKRKNYKKYNMVQRNKRIHTKNLKNY